MPGPWGFGRFPFGSGPFGVVDWSEAMTVDVWPEELRELVESRGGKLLDFCSAVRPIWDWVIMEARRTPRCYDAFGGRCETVFIGGFWWDGKEVKDSVTVTLYAEMDHPLWDRSFRLLKGAEYVDTVGRIWTVVDFRLGYPVGYVRNGASYNDLIEVDIACSRLSDVTIDSVPPGVFHGVRLRDGLVERVGETIGAKVVDGMTARWKRLVVGKRALLTELKGTPSGVDAFGILHGFRLYESSLYWLGVEGIARIPAPFRRTAYQSHYQYPVFWGDGVSAIIASDGVGGAACKYLRDDPDYRGDLIDPGVGVVGNVVVEFWVDHGGVAHRFVLQDVGLGGGVGKLVPKYVYPSILNDLGRVTYSSGRIQVQGADLATPGAVLSAFSKFKPVLVTFKRAGEYTCVPIRYPLFDEVPADFRPADLLCSEPGGAVEFFDMTVADVIAPALPYATDSVWEFKLSSPSCTIQFPVIPKMGSALGAWADVSGRWLLEDIDGNEHYLESVYVPGPLDPPVPHTLFRVKGTVPIAAGLAVSLTYICPEGSNCEAGLSHRVLMVPGSVGFWPVFEWPIASYLPTLRARYSEVTCAHEDPIEWV